jgi:hypothetical protein
MSWRVRSRFVDTDAKRSPRMGCACAAWTHQRWQARRRSSTPGPSATRILARLQSLRQNSCTTASMRSERHGRRSVRLARARLPRCFTQYDDPGIHVGITDTRELDRTSNPPDVYQPNKTRGRRTNIRTVRWNEPARTKTKSPAAPTRTSSSLLMSARHASAQKENRVSTSPHLSPRNDPSGNCVWNKRVLMRHYMRVTPTSHPHPHPHTPPTHTPRSTDLLLLYERRSSVGCLWGESIKGHQHLNCAECVPEYHGVNLSCTARSRRFTSGVRYHPCE